MIEKQLLGVALVHTPPLVRNLYRIKGTNEFVRDYNIKYRVRQERIFYSVYIQVSLVNDAPYYDKTLGNELLSKGCRLSISKAVKIINHKGQ